MFGKLLPRKTSFFDYFDQHAELVVQSSQALVEMVNTGTDLAVAAQKITQLEKQADSVIHQCVAELHKTFITPFERDDIYKLISNMDDIVDFIEDAAVRFVLYRIDTIPEPAKELAGLLFTASKEVEQVVKELRFLDKIEEMQARFVRIHSLENESDATLRSALSLLFEVEKDPILIMKVKEIYEILENAVDSCEHVSNIVEGVIIENS